MRHSAKLIITLMGLSLLLISCGKGSDGDKGATAPNIEALKVSKLTNNSWCFVDNMTEDFQVVSRMKFNGKGEFGDGSKSRLDYLRITPKLATQVHLAERENEWLIKKADDDFLWSDRFTVELIEDQFRISSLKNYREQGLIFDQILKNHPHVKVSGNKFAPQVAVSVKSGGLLGGGSERIGYPCSSFSPSFLAQTPSRPMVEFKLFLNQSIWTSMHEYRHDDGSYKFEKAMLIDFPIKVSKKTSSANLEGSSWCSWYQLGDMSTHLKLITFKENKFLEQTYLDYLFERNNTEETLFEELNKKAKDASVYSIDELNNGRIYGSYESELNGSQFTVKRLFFSIKDSNGVEFLAKGNPYYPDNSSFSFSDLYFKCSDSRPLELNSGFKENISKIIEIQQASHQSEENE